MQLSCPDFLVPSIDSATLTPLEIAFSYGAKIFEFHFTDSRKNRKFRDHKISLDYKRTVNLIQKFKEIQKMSGIIASKSALSKVLGSEINHLNLVLQI